MKWCIHQKGKSNIIAPKWCVYAPYVSLQLVKLPTWLVYWAGVEGDTTRLLKKPLNSTVY